MAVTSVDPLYRFIQLKSEPEQHWARRLCLTNAGCKFSQYGWRYMDTHRILHSFMQR